MNGIDVKEPLKEGRLVKVVVLQPLEGTIGSHLKY